MWKKSLKSIYFLVGLFSFLYCLIGYPELLDKWIKYLGIEADMKTVIDQNVIRWIAFAVGMILIGIWSGAYKKGWQKLRRPKRDLSTGSVLIEDEEIINDTLSPLKIEVQEDGIAYFRVEDEKGHFPQGSKKQVLSIRVYSKEAIDDVKVYISEIETFSYDNDTLQNLLPICLNFKNVIVSHPVSFSADETQQVDVVSYSSGRQVCHFQLEQFGEGEKPEVFISSSPVCCKIQIKIYGKNVSSSQQSFKIYYKEPLQYNYANNSKQRIFMKRISEEQQHDIIDSQQKTIESLKEQQHPKLEVTFEKGKKPYLESFRKMSPITKRDGQLYYYRIRVENTCSEIIKNVNVKLMKIEECPEGFSAERCNLEFMHHPGVKAKDIQPYDDEFVDIIGYFEPFNKDIKKKEMYMLTAGGMLKLYIPAEKCDITIKINSDNGGKPIIKHFKFSPTRKNKEDFMEMD